MTLKQLNEVKRHARLAGVELTYQRTAYFQHTVYIGKSCHTARDEAIAHIDRLRTLPSFTVNFN